MKRRVCIVVLSVAALTLSGCSALRPPVLPALPGISEGSSAEENLPSVQEIELSEAEQQSGSRAATRAQEKNTLEEQTVEPFETGTVETVSAADDAQKPLETFLTQQDENYIYEVAYRTGDYSSLDEQQTQVMSVAVQIIAQCRELSDYEKALFVHDYLTATITYGFSENPYNAYGALVEHVSVCQGYAYAFKLCMDLLEIPCITVGGTADNGGEVLSHAWNMIQLNGQWYHVDVTWDDATTSVDYGSWCHLYFCVDDSFIAQNHAWTDLVQDFHGMGEIPVAEDTTLFYFQQVQELLYSQEQLEQAFDADFQTGLRSGEYCCYGFEPDPSFIGNYAAGSLITQEIGDYVLLFITLQ